MSSKILILFLFFLFIYSKDLYYSGSNPRPANICLDHELIDIPLTSDSVAIDSLKVKYTPENNLDTVTLTESGVKFTSSYMYLKDKQDWQNGFVLSFNMDIDRPTCYVFDDTQCALAVNQCWWRANKETKSRCGADGFSVILRFSPYNGGISGGGMGYAGIMKALAIEFDTFTSTDRNDPQIEEERHISVIVRPGENLADEDDSIAWNYQPLNFKSDLFEGFLKNPSYRIEYLNKNLRVFINDKLQLEFYDDLDLRNRIKDSSNLLYLGIVAATGASTNDHILSNVKVSIVKPTIAKFKIEFEEQTTTFKSYEAFHIKVYMYDNCGNFYTPNFEGGLDNYKYLSIIKDDCEVINLQNGEKYDYKSRGPAFIISMKCTKVGDKEFKVLYKEETIPQTLKATIIPGNLYKAEVIFRGGSGSTDATEGRADKPFVFDVKTYDFAGNRVDTNEDELRNQISILWPTASDSRTDYIIKKKQDGIWTYTVDCNFIGYYKIQSSLFYVHTGNSEYVFKIIAGSPDLMKSQGKIYSINGTQMKENEIFAGTKGLLKVTFMDKLGNFVSKVEVEKYAVELKTMLGSNLIESNYLAPIMSSRIEFTKKGGNKVIPTYENGQINCPYCQFLVKPGAPIFKNSGLLIFDDEKTQYVINSGPEFEIVKPKQMNFLFVLKDEYFNILDVFDPKGFSATLSGNNMSEPLVLNMESFANGAKITTKSENQEVFDALIGFKGYVITVKNDKGETLTFPLTIKSDGSDSDADNSALFPQGTAFSWITPLFKNLYAIAGTTYKLSIKLITVTGKRYPRWIPNDQISLTLIPFREDEKVFQIQRDQKPGTYTVEFIVKKAGAETRSGLIRVNGANAIKGPKFKVNPGNPSIATIDELNMKDGNNNLKDATVFTEYVFQVHLRDDYKNAVSDLSTLNLLVQNIDKKEISFVPDCVATSVGEYNCKFTPKSAGNFKVQSGYINTNYILVILNGEPSALTTKASIINDLSVELKAGEIIKFKITPKDSTGALLRKEESSSSINNYTLTLRKPDGSLLGITISSNNIQENGEILTETEVTLAGMYSYAPLLFGKNIMCEICAFELVANELDHTKIKVFTLNKDSRQEITVDQTIMIDNKKILPIYYIQFYDKYYNRKPVNSDYSEWTGVLSVPNSKEKSYNLISKNVNGDIQYNINSDKYEMFETELFQENCSLFFKGKNSVDGLKDISVLFPKVILSGNGDNDKIYSDDSIDPKNCRVSPTQISILAGEFVTISIELRAPNGKLYYDRPLGWFNQTNMPKAFKLILFDDVIQEFNVTTGKLYGSYSVSFLLTVANYRAEDLIVSYLESTTNKYIEINQRASITVQPNSFNFLLLQNLKAVEQDCIATEVRSLSFIAYDRFNNKINYTAQASLVGLQVKSNNYSINPSFDSDSNTNLIKISFECKIVGLINVLSTKFLEKYNGKIVESYQINVIAGPISPKNSLAKLNKDSIIAGESVIWTVYPKDIYDNEIQIDKNNVNHLPDLFISSETIEDVEKSIGKANIVDNTYQWEITLTKAGVHSFKTFYQSSQKDLISSSFNKVKVAPLSMIFENVNLAKYEKSSANFLEYDREDGFSQDIKEVPEFRLNFYDKYDNRIETTTILFDTRLFLDDPSLETFSYQQRIEFCSSDNIRYSICENNGENQTKLEQNPRTRWSVLVPNLQYRLNLINKKDLSTKLFILNVTGISNNDTSNLPLDVDNTIIQPNSLLTTIAGQSTQFSIELRTTNPNLRRNFWFDDPNKSIKLNFKYNQSTISYDIVKGDITDRYFVTILGKEAHSAEDPNEITVVINNQTYQKYKPLWVVKPAKLNSINPINSETKEILSNIPQDQTVDSLYTVHFLAKDIFENPVILSEINNVIVSGNKVGNTLFELTLISNGIFRVSFQPKRSDEYVLSFKNEVDISFKTTIKQGVINIPNSFATLLVNNKEISGSLKAGAEIQIQFYPMDKWNNRIVLDLDLVKNSKFKYFVSKPSVEGYFEGKSESKIKEDLNTVEFLEKLTIKGDYTFKASLKDQEIRMILSIVKIVPADFDLEHSILKYFDIPANKYLTMDRLVAIKEDNMKEEPKYLLTLADVYDNEFENFNENPNDFDVILTGNDYTINPVYYISNQIIGNALAIYLNGANLTLYKNGIYKKDPYTLNITFNEKRTILYKVTLLGQGDKADKDAQINVPEDLSQTYFSKSSIQLKAGEYETYLLEIRTVEGKRKSDFNKTIQFKVLDSVTNKELTQGFSIKKEDGTLRGSFIVTVYGERANPINPYLIQTLVVEEQGLIPIPKKVNLTVIANKLSSIEIVSELSIPSTADQDFIFEVLPYDKFDNVADVSESEVNLKIVFPSSLVPSPDSYTSNKDPSTGILQYIVKSRRAGVYTIESSILKNKKSRQFQVTPGKVSSANSRADIEPNTGTIVAGDSLIVNILAYDSYNNFINASENSQGNSLLNSFSVNLAQQELKFKYTLEENLANGGLITKFIYTKSGLISILPSLLGSAIKCDGCEVKVSPGKLDLKQTKFLARSISGNFNETNIIETRYGDREANFNAKLYDIYSNLLEDIPINYSFKLTMSGNNMKPIQFEVAKDNINTLYCSIKDSQTNGFSRLVPRSNYTLTLDYFEGTAKKDTTNLLLKIIGEDNGSGNGDYEPGYLKIYPQFITLIAGEKGYINIELQTKEKKRFNGVFDLGIFDASEDVDSTEPDIKLKTEFFYGNDNGKVLMSIYGTKSYTTSKIFIVSVNQTKIMHQRIRVDLDPSFPELSKTELISPKDIDNIVSVPTDEPVEILFQLKDKFDNLYANDKLSNKLSGKIVNNGSALIEDTTMDLVKLAYLIKVIPNYPPRTLDLMIYYSDDGLIQYPILRKDISYIITTSLEPNNTEIIGSKINGFTIEEDFSFLVLVKDNKGYCYEPNLAVNVTISGPYLTNNVNDMTYTTENPHILNETRNTFPLVPSLNDSSIENLTSSGYVCMKYYEVLLEKNIIQSTGYYQIDIYVIGEDNSKLAKSIRKTYVKPGKIDPKNILINAPALYNRGSNPISIMVNTPMNFQIILRDKFKNIINEYRPYNGSMILIIPNLDSNQYSKNITYLSENATFTGVVVVKKTGVLSNLIFNFMDKDYNLDNIEKKDFPTSITVLSGPCSTEKTEFLGIKTNAVIGEKQLFTIKCKDIFDNEVIVGGNEFSVGIKGQDLSVVGIDVVNAAILDLKNGKYEVNFRFSWAGEYEVKVYFSNGVQVGQPFKIQVQGSKCPNPSKPFYCLNLDKCAANYLECGINNFLCKNSLTPVSCDGKTDNCQKFTHLCSCQEGYIRCDDGRCVPEEKYSDYCFFGLQLMCPQEFSIDCGYGLCRKDVSNCPTNSGCPPGTTLCADYTCVDSRTKCPEFETCPFNQFYRCPDMTCTDNPLKCSTRITCSNRDYIVCPDKTCAKSEIDCKLPSNCPTDSDGNKMILCPDQSCRSKKEDCPIGITCPLGHALCEDGVCRVDCMKQVATSRLLSGSKLYRLLANSSEETVVEDPNCKFICPGGECIDNYYKCPSVESCPEGLIKCPDFSCVKNTNQCVKTICPKGKLHCWDGNCVSDKSKCATRTTCPNDYVKCTDGSCKKSLDQCLEPISCPAYKPYKCANGDCRAKSSECPTLITCPVSRPVLCPDSSCRKNKDECRLPTEKLVCEEGKIICPDGSCAHSKDLCPTLPSCNEGQIRCWDNSCSYSLELCPILANSTNVCPVNSPLRCADGSCRDLPENCPTQIICPADRPVKCDDGTCLESNSQCSLNSQCPTSLIRCPDGSCSIVNCGVGITCAKSAPYKCYDGTCKRDPRDCPSIPQCSDQAPILCPDGTCVSQRVNCKGNEPCKEGKVRCPDMFCYESVANCTEVSGCPGGRFLCEDGSCAKSSQDCPAQKCPAHLPKKCFDGFCVSDLKYCDNSTTGCPYNKQFKCYDGNCASDIYGCPNNNTIPTDSKICKENDVLCPDGSCARSKLRCPNAVGCPLEAPIKCGNGLCIDPLKAECSVANCPKETPIKCLNGLCAKSISFCSSFIPLNDYSNCEKENSDNKIPCADGRCVPNADLCRPLFPCDEDSVRCSDGSCRPIKQLCPLTNSCPENKKYRCESGACAKNDRECPNDVGCTLQNPVKCPLTGTCAKENKQCLSVYEKTITMNFCPIHKPIKCSKDAGSLCVSNEKECKSDKVCLEIDKPYLCADGTCVKERVNCKKMTNSNSKTCPIQCANGDCAKTPFSCPSIVVCPKFKPYLCADGECQGDRALCRTQQSCPDEKPFRCPDMSCSSDLSLCSKQALCPITSPILCPNGLCTSNAVDCISIDVIGITEEKPFLCANGDFVEYPKKCVSNSVASGRLLQDNNSTVSNIDSGCTAELPFLCSDGNCQLNEGYCSIIKGCPISKPYRCAIGVCETNSKKCAQHEKPVLCANNLTSCEDGICRRKCPRYNGCPSNLPYHCPNGFCGRKPSECAGDSICPLETPYRCIDNRCVKDMSKCSTPKRNFYSETLMISVAPIATSTFDFIRAGFDSQINLGKIIIPAGSLLVNKTETETNSTTTSEADVLSHKQFVISPISENLVREASNIIDHSKKQYTDTIFPYSAAKLSYHQSVRSPIVKIEALDRNNSKYRFPILLYLSSDLAVNTSKTEDYCLGKLDLAGNKWECHNRKLIQEEFDSDKLGYPVGEDGTYAVIFNPTPAPPTDNGEPCGWFCEYKDVLLWSLVGIISFSIVASFIVWRISRYMTKYREAKKQMTNYRAQISELEQAQTDVQGQTLKDKIEGISFTANPAFKEQNEGDLGSRINQMEDALEKLAKRDKLLDNANKELKERNSLLSEEYNNLKKECKDKGI